MKKLQDDFGRKTKWSDLPSRCHTSSCGELLKGENNREQEQTIFVTIQAKNDEYLDEGSGTRDAEEGKDYRTTQYPKNKHSY